MSILNQRDAETFVRACLVARWDAAWFVVAEQISQHRGFDWDATRRVALDSGVAPLLYSALRDTPLLPHSLLQECRQAYIQTAANNTLRIEELSAIVEALTAVDVAVIVLKGQALLEVAYGNAALRPMVDVDILVHQADVPAALRALQLLDYRPIGRELAPHTALAFENELLLGKAGRIEWLVELHWHLLNSTFYQQRLPESVMWDSKQPIAVNGRSCFVLGPEMHLLHLSSHLMLHHEGEGLLWWADIAEFLRRTGPAIDWDRVLLWATTYELLLPLKMVLSKMVDEWGVPLPADVTAALAAATPSETEQVVFRQLTDGSRPAAKRLLDDLSGLENWGARAAFLRHNLFPSAAYMDDRYAIANPGLRPAYYLLRWALGVSALVKRAGPPPTIAMDPEQDWPSNQAG